MVQKDRLIELVQRSHAELVRFAESLSAAERRPGDGEQWTARDLLAHMVESWRGNTADMNTYDRVGAVPTAVTDLDAENAARIAEYRARSWEELRQTLDQRYAAVLALIERLTVAELNDPQRYSFLNARPPWRALMSDTFLHPLASHLRPWYLQHGQREYATQLAEAEARLLLGLDDAPDWQGVTLYNLACHYALLGEKEKALEKLEAGLRLNPGLIDFSRQDSDLASLHAAPEYEAVLSAASAVE